MLVARPRKGMAKGIVVVVWPPPLRWPRGALVITAYGVVVF